MIDTSSFRSQLGDSDIDIDPNPTKEELQKVVERFKSEGLCGRRVAEHQLGPYFITSPVHGQREIELLDEVIEETYADTDLCIATRQSECSRFRGGCKGNQ
jgi:hypothetical protein